MTKALLDSAVLAQLCEDLAPIIAAEIAAGNVVDETARDWPASVSVFLLRPFRARVTELPEHVLFRRVNDPHYWLAEYCCTKHDHILACKFGG